MKLSVMTRCAAAVLALGGSLVGASRSSGAVLGILDVEGLNSPDYSNLAARTNVEDLTYDNVAMRPVGTEATNEFGGHSSFTSVRVSSFDFGENYADLRIVETWSKTRASAPAANETPTGFSMLWWDNAITGENNATFTPADGDVEETTLNFFLNQTAGEDNTWFRDVGLTEALAVAPQARYLKVMTAAGEEFGNGNVFSEVAFVGTVVPEPASLSVVGFGALAVLMKRRRR